MRLSAVIGACALICAGRVSAQSFPAMGPEFQVNVTSAATQADPAIAAQSSNGYVVVWRSGADIIGRRFDAAGLPLGPEFIANVAPVSAAAPAVAARAEGGFIVVWQAPDGSGDGIFARRYDTDGVPFGGVFAVNSATSGTQLQPRIAAATRGYVIIWGSSSPPYGMARLFDANAAPLREFPTSATSEADVAMTPTGFVIVWAEGAQASVRAQLFDTVGNAGLNTLVASGLIPPAFTQRSRTRVGAAADGSFTVSWGLISFYFITGAPPVLHTTDHGTFIRRYDGAGTPRGGERRVNDFDAGAQDEGALAVSRGGRLLSAWTSWPQPPCSPGCAAPPPQDGSGAGIFARFIDAAGNDIGGEVQVNTTTAGDQKRPAAAAAGESSALVVWQGPGGLGIFGRRFGYPVDSVLFEVDIAASGTANGNGVLEPGEQAVIAPGWRNLSGAPLALTSFALLRGPAGPVYETLDNDADFGVMAHGATASCRDTGNCFVVSASGSRPAHHWDAELVEQVAPATLLGPRVRTVHVGDSYGDVARSSPFNRFIEIVFHRGVMESCDVGVFCPAYGVSRAHMAAYVLRAFQPALTPPACVAGSERFADVPASSPACPWIEELARRNVVAGCGNGNYCPDLMVTRETLAVYLLLTREGSGYAPPACTTPLFADVPAWSPFCRWIEELARRQVVAGCGNGNYCPDPAVTREQMSVFLSQTFGLTLYVP